MSSLRIFLLSFFLSLGINGPTFSQTEDSLVIASPLSKEHLERNIKGSYGFLSNREPVLNQGEYAIVEKFMPFLDEDPDFALEMIEGLTANNPSLTASFDFVLEIYKTSNFGIRSMLDPIFPRLGGSTVSSDFGFVLAN